MALIKCPECNKEVSDRAVTCPHCGYQLRNVQNRAYRLVEKEHDRKCKELIAGGIILLIAAIVFLFFLGHPVVKYSGELLGTIIGSSIGSGISGIILLAVGIHRLNE